MSAEFSTPPSPPSEDPPDKQELRAYSKRREEEHVETYGVPPFDSRAAAVTEIKRLRGWRDREHERELRNRRRTAEVATDLSTQELELAEIDNEQLNLEQKVERLGQLIQDHETSLVTRIMARLRKVDIQAIRDDYAGSVDAQGSLDAQRQLVIKRIGWKGDDLESLADEAAHIQANIDSYNCDARAYVARFYDLVERSYDWDKEQKRRKLELDTYRPEYGRAEDRVLKNGHFLIHGVMAKYYLGFGNNDAINNQSTYQERIAYAVAKQPTMCTSTFGAGGDSRVQLWSGFGVVLNGGVVEAAFAGDAATKADADGNRATTVASIEQYEEGLSRALSQGSIEKYNEVIVSAPQMAAVFVAIDQMPGRPGIEELTANTAVWHTPQVEEEKYQVIDMADILSTANTLGLPLVAFENGRGFLIEADTAGDAFRVVKEVTPQELLSWRYELPDDPEIIELANKAAKKPLAMV